MQPKEIGTGKPYPFIVLSVFCATLSLHEGLAITINQPYPAQQSQNGVTRKAIQE